MCSLESLKCRVLVPSDSYFFSVWNGTRTKKAQFNTIQLQHESADIKRVNTIIYHYFFVYHYFIFLYHQNQIFSNRNDQR